jgi:hypothetical protein
VIDPPATRAGIDGTIQARRLKDGAWRYQTPLLCPNCGMKWSEVHDQAVRCEQLEK